MEVLYVVVGMGIFVLAVRAVVASRRLSRQKYYCDSCSQYLGMGRNRQRVCPRCGDNRYYIR